jgi:hypothetical protein
MSEYIRKMRTGSIKIFTLLLFLQPFIFQFCLFSQLPPKDQVIDTIHCISQKDQSYALYLPSQYDAKKQWPVIMIFDPSARGRTAVQIFSEAARKYGYILACSNNSRNGPMTNNFNAASAVLQDLLKRFSIDQKRIYASGFSGGSRFAIALATAQNGIAGIIGCGAGLPNDKTLMPSGNSDFLYYGLAGTRDMNYLEMNELPGFFSDQTRIVSYLRFFEGGHQWPEAAMITDAVEWLTFQAMNRKIIPSDQVFITDIRNKTQQLINTELNAGNLTDAIMHMRFAERDFQGTSFASEMTKIIFDSEKSASYRDAAREWKRMAGREQEKRENYVNYLSEIVYSGSFPDSASNWWKKETGSLLRLRDKGTSEKSHMASRLLNFISILCSEQGTAYYKSKFYLQASVLFEICTLSNSENPLNYYNLARAMAGSGNTKESVDALTAAVNHGFSSRKTVESDPVFVKIRGNVKYISILQKMK